MRNFAILTGFALLLICAAAIPATAQEPSDAGKEIERLQALIAEKEKKIEELTRALQEVQETMKKLQAQKSRPEARPEPAQAEALAPKVAKISGKITHVKMDKKSVLIDIGKSAGLKPDDILTVSRVGRILGKVKVCIIIDNSLSNAEILESADDFLPGDDVTSESASVVAPVPAPKQSPTEEAPVQPKVVKAPETPLSPEAADLHERLSRVEEKLASISERLAKLESALTEPSQKTGVPSSEPVHKEEVTPAPAAEQVKPQPGPSIIQARVADVEGGSVYIWAGTNQGVKEGDIFAIKRDGKVIARVKVDQVEPETGDMCRGQVISKTADIDKKTDIAEKE